MRVFAPFLVVALAAFGLALASVPEAEPTSGLPEALEKPAPPPAPPEPPPPVRQRLGAVRFDEALGAFVAPWGAQRARLTLDPELQRQVAGDLADGKPFYGATVVLEAKTGRVLALAEASQRTPERAGVALRADAPAASVFKLISAAALLENGVSPDQEVCVSGGRRRLSPAHLRDRPRDACVRFADVVPLSLNAAMAKLTDRYLPPGALEATAARFGFGQPLPLEVEVEPSTADIPADRFGRANTAAGFGEVRLSALHAAALTSMIANRGVLVPPRLVEEVEGGPTPPLEAPRAVLDPSVAEALARMMAETTTRGTARRTFSKIKAGSPLEGVRVGAKTGSLLFYDEHVDHSWLVAFAPVEDPEVVVASVVVNDWQLWYTKAGPLARKALEAGLATVRAVNERPAPPTRRASAGGSP